MTTSISQNLSTQTAPVVAVGQTESDRFGHEAMRKTSNPIPTASVVIPGAPTQTQSMGNA